MGVRRCGMCLGVCKVSELLKITLCVVLSIVHLWGYTGVNKYGRVNYVCLAGV